MRVLLFLVTILLALSAFAQGPPGSTSKFPNHVTLGVAGIHYFNGKMTPEDRYFSGGQYGSFSGTTVGIELEVYFNQKLGVVASVYHVNRLGSDDTLKYSVNSYSPNVHTNAEIQLQQLEFPFGIRYLPNYWREKGLRPEFTVGLIVGKLLREKSHLSTEFWSEEDGWTLSPSPRTKWAGGTFGYFGSAGVQYAIGNKLTMAARARYIADRTEFHYNDLSASAPPSIPDLNSRRWELSLVVNYRVFSR